jgi:hypothetical protein
VTDHITTRAGLIRSFRAACAAATPANTMLANPINLAGMLLFEELSAARALERLQRFPNSAGLATAAQYLAEIVEQEGADTERPRAAGGVGR